MEFFEGVKKRRSIRKYKSEPVPLEMLSKVLEAARLAPSTSNTQSWKFKVVTDPGTRRAIAEASYSQKFIAHAPVIIACCIDFHAFKEKGRRAMKLVLKGAVRPSIEMILRSVRGGKDSEFDAERVVVHGIINVSIATEHIALAAQDLGLGTCWIRAFEAEKVEELLDLPQGVTVLALLTVGYPAQDPSPRPRKSLEDILITQADDGA